MLVRVTEHLRRDGEVEGDHPRQDHGDDAMRRPNPDASRRLRHWPSGMAAIATTLVALLRAGDTLVASRQVYGDTDDLLERDLSALGITVVRVDALDTAAWSRAVAEHRPTVVYGETLSNRSCD